MTDSPELQAARERAQKAFQAGFHLSIREQKVEILAREILEAQKAEAELAPSYVLPGFASFRARVANLQRQIEEASR